MEAPTPNLSAQQRTNASRRPPRGAATSRRVLRPTTRCTRRAVPERRADVQAVRSLDTARARAHDGSTGRASERAFIEWAGAVDGRGHRLVGRRRRELPIACCYATFLRHAARQPAQEGQAHHARQRAFGAPRHARLVHNTRYLEAPPDAGSAPASVTTSTPAHTASRKAAATGHGRGPRRRRSGARLHCRPSAAVTPPPPARRRMLRSHVRMVAEAR